MMLTVKSILGRGCSMVTEVMTCSIAQGVTIMMNVKDIADKDLREAVKSSFFMGKS